MDQNELYQALVNSLVLGILKENKICFKNGHLKHWV